MTKLISGYGSLSRLAELQSMYRDKRLLLVTGRGSFSACGARDIINDVLGEENVWQFDDFATNPKIEDAERGVAFARDKNIELILAVGGGSVLDMAKLIKALLVQPEASHDLARGSVSVIDPGVPLIMVPTTAGSGSEATHFAVVYIGMEKFSLASQALLPDAIILDGSLTASGTSYQKACNGLDALAQAIESTWAASATDESRELSIHALERCMKHFPAFIQTTPAKSTTQGMMEAANLAGQAINVSRTTAAHAWSYGITTHYGVPHGHAVWLTLPEIFQKHVAAPDGAVSHPEGIASYRALMTKMMRALSLEDATQAGQDLRKFLRSLDIESDLSAMGPDTAEKRTELARMVNQERLSNNPVQLGHNDIAHIFDV